VRDFVAVVTLMLAVPLSARARPLAPGGSGAGTAEYNDGTHWPLPPPEQWRGALLAERSEPYAFNAINRETGARYFVRGTFTSRVYRDAGTGGLAFEYALAESEANYVRDLEEVKIAPLAGFTTDVYFSRDDFIVNRSADGGTLDFRFDLEDIAGTFLVRTDAPAFDADGRFDLDMDVVFGDQGDGAAFATFRPVPEPAGAAAALLAACGLLRRRGWRVTGYSPRRGTPGRPAGGRPRWTCR
jgi:hypothetical protein